MAGLYDQDDNVVPDLHCYEMLPTDAEFQIAQAFSRSEPAGGFKPTAPTHTPDAPFVARRSSSECPDVMGLGVPVLSDHDVFENSHSEPDHDLDVQAVPSLLDTLTTGPNVPSYNMASSIQPKQPADDSNKQRSSQELPDHVPSNLLGLLVKHRQKNMEEKRSAKLEDPNSYIVPRAWISDLLFEGRCDCDAHIVPRWDIEE